VSFFQYGKAEPEKTFFLPLSDTYHFTLTPVISPLPSNNDSPLNCSQNGRETWQRGTIHRVTWDYTGDPGTTVKLVLLNAGAEVGTIIGAHH
jgi:hypothetical protein